MIGVKDVRRKPSRNNRRAVAFDAFQDLAVLKTTAKMLPAPLATTPPALRETMTVYAFGFPLGDALASGRRNPAISIGKGTISSLREDEAGRLRRIQLDTDSDALQVF